jgi:phosphatidylglycerol---prolipoprotein diacylglyceryl transferase
MLTYPNINPIALTLGPLKIHWYGLTYLFGFCLAWCLAKWRIKRLNLPWTEVQLTDLFFYVAIGVIVGGRIGYCLFYSLDFWYRPWIVFEIWEGGMSFHGGLLGVITALYFLQRKIQKDFFEIGDFIAPLVPVGLAMGRIGNFINDELWGRITNVPWAMVFPKPEAGPWPRHPSQLYEFFLEGLILFLILWIYSRKPRIKGTSCALFLLLYGIFRFVLEFFRQPDAQLGFIAWGWLTMGQLLCIPLIVSGFILLCAGYKRYLSYRPNQSSPIKHNS